MHTIMFIQNIELSYILTSRKYANFATSFFSCQTGNVSLVRLTQICEPRDHTCESQTFHNYKQAQITSSNALKGRRYFLPREYAFFIKKFINSFFIKLSMVLQRWTEEHLTCRCNIIRSWCVCSELKPWIISNVWILVSWCIYCSWCTGWAKKNVLKFIFVSLK